MTEMGFLIFFAILILFVVIVAVVVVVSAVAGAQRLPIRSQMTTMAMRDGMKIGKIK